MCWHIQKPHTELIYQKTVRILFLIRQLRSNYLIFTAKLFCHHFFFFLQFFTLAAQFTQSYGKKKHLVNKTSLKGISCCSSLVAEKKTNIHYSGTKTLRRPSRPPCPPIVSLLELCRVILPNNTSINVYMILKCHIMISLLQQHYAFTLVVVCTKETRLGMSVSKAACKASHEDLVPKKRTSLTAYNKAQYFGKSARRSFLLGNKMETANLVHHFKNIPMSTRIQRRRCQKLVICDPKVNKRLTCQLHTI